MQFFFRFSGPRYPHAHKRGRRRRSLLRQDVKLLQLLLLSLWGDNDDRRSAGGDKVPGRAHEVAVRDARAGAGADPEPGASGAEQRGRAAAGDGATPHTVRIHASQVEKMRHNCYSFPNGIQTVLKINSRSLTGRFDNGGGGGNGHVMSTSLSAEEKSLTEEGLRVLVAEQRRQVFNSN